MLRHPHRLIALAGASNFRDLGGYAGHRGRPVRWGLIYRSDHLGLLTPADRQELKRRGVAARLDFRGRQEGAAAASGPPEITLHALSIEPTVVQSMHALTASGQILNEARAVGLMEDLYRALVLEHSPRFAQFFGHLLAAPGPLVFHCTAGKDRTGLAAALLLQALDVPRDVVLQDYLLTNEVFRPPAVPRGDLPAAVVKTLWGVRTSYLQAAWDVIDEHHGGLQAYLHQQLGLDETALLQLRQRYLEEQTAAA